MAYKLIMMYIACGIFMIPLVRLSDKQVGMDDYTDPDGRFSIFFLWPLYAVTLIFFWLAIIASNLKHSKGK